jgi:hypothetical protein
MKRKIGCILLLLIKDNGGIAYTQLSTNNGATRVGEPIGEIAWRAQ